MIYIAGPTPRQKMLSPTAIALYTFGGVWLALKYRVLLREPTGKNARFIGELMTAVTVAFSVVVVPSVPIGETAWCPDVKIPVLVSVALMLAVTAPLVSPTHFSPLLAISCAMLTAAYLGQTACWGVATVLIGVLIVHAMLYIYDQKIKQEEKDTFKQQ